MIGTALVTGAGGFIGRVLCAELRRRGWRVRAAVRDAARAVPGTETVVTGDLAHTPDLAGALRSVDAVIHLAALVHDLGRTAAAAAYEAINCEATESLAYAASTAGVKRFVFVSTLKVNGERIPAGARLGPSDPVRPEGSYALSKWHAEQALARVASQTRLEVVVVRPPLVYGPGVGANFLRLMRLVERRIPLPFRAVRNRRSLVYVENLADVLALCASQPAASGQTLLVSDGEDLSTPDLIARLAAALHVEPRLFALPEGLLRVLLALAGRSAEGARLLDSLALDATHTMRLLGWQPRFSVDDGMASTAGWYRSLVR